VKWLSLKEADDFRVNEVKSGSTYTVTIMQIFPPLSNKLAPTLNAAQTVRIFPKLSFALV
jgi:hypothetical protein